MIRNGQDIPAGTVIRSRVCVVGTGQAGVTVAWCLQNAGIDVVLIEGSRAASSLQASWPDKKLLYAGEVAGVMASNEPDFLTSPLCPDQSPSERERFFGGTSTHWGGQSRPLDAVDFEERPWFPGWPITRADLDPYYAQAVSFCMLHGHFDDGNFGRAYWTQVLGLDGSEMPTLDNFDDCMYQFVGSAYLDFSTRTFPDGKTIGESAADVILNASLLDIVAGDGSVARLRVASMNDASVPGVATKFFIEADAYVLACGAVANAQRLLISNIGNEYDQVGRYFMCHPLSMGVNVGVSGFPAPPLSNLMAGQDANGRQWSDTNGVRVTGRFQLTADALREYGIGNCWMRSYTAPAYFEMSPNPDSRITLTNNADNGDEVFGQPKVRIDWQFGPRDQTTYETATALFAAAIKPYGGVLYPPAWSSIARAVVVNGHHLGTTRMSTDPEKGVVDANLKVHSMDNLYVAGSSVFVTAGVSNPTFTIIALSIRLAEHLARRFGVGA
jgi:choline dehydrogenase-like flavoprotein